MSAVIENPELPATLSVELSVTQDLTTKIAPSGALALADVWDVDSSEMAQAASNQRTEWARQIDEIKNARADFLGPAKKIMEAAAKWFNPAINDREAGRDLLGKKLLEWDKKEKARIAKEREDREAAAAAAEATERANAAIEQGEAKATQAQVAVVAAAAPVSEPGKISGTSVRENWVPILNQGVTEEAALIQIIQAAATDQQLRGLLKLDQPALNRLAKALKNAMRVPGYTARDVPTLAGSRK